jgi:hypothetical protein
VFCCEQLTLASRSTVGCLDCDFQTVFVGEQLAAFFLVGQRSDCRIEMLRQCFVVSSCFLAGPSAVRWMDWDVQTVFCGEQLPFVWSVSGPIEGTGCSDSVFW